jgi:hypothetical protein
MNIKPNWLLGQTKGSNPQNVYLRDFSWECGWYWSGGSIGNNRFSAHFDGAFLDAPDVRGHILGNFVSPWTKNPTGDYGVIQNGWSVWEDLSKFLDNPQYTSQQWWRIKDLFKQFYTLQKAAEVFQYGGHCTSDNRNPLELDMKMANKINEHIETIIIPEIRKALNKV